MWISHVDIKIVKLNKFKSLYAEDKLLRSQRMTDKTPMFYGETI